MNIILLGIIAYPLFFPKPAHAYLDPGSGSYILQMVFGLFISLSFIFRTSLKRLIIYIKKTIFRKDESTQKDKSD